MIYDNEKEWTYENTSYLLIPLIFASFFRCVMAFIRLLVLARDLEYFIYIIVPFAECVCELLSIATYALLIFQLPYSSSEGILACFIPFFVGYFIQIMVFAVVNVVRYTSISDRVRPLQIWHECYTYWNFNITFYFSVLIFIVTLVIVTVHEYQPDFNWFLLVCFVGCFPFIGFLICISYFPILMGMICCSSFPIGQFPNYNRNMFFYEKTSFFLIYCLMFLGLGGATMTFWMFLFRLMEYDISYIYSFLPTEVCCYTMFFVFVILIHHYHLMGVEFRNTSGITFERYRVYNKLLLLLLID